MVKYFLQWLENKAEQRAEKKLNTAMHRDYYERCSVTDDDGYGEVAFFGGHNPQALETTRIKFNKPNFIPDGYILL